MKKAVSAVCLVTVFLSVFLFGCGKTNIEYDSTDLSSESQNGENDLDYTDLDESDLPEWEHDVYNDGELQGTYFITKYNGSNKNVNVPSEIDGVKVTGIGGDSFYENQVIEEVFLPSSILRIAPQAFYKAENLKKIDFNEELTFIGEMAFAYCNSLREVTLPRDLETIELNAFACCKNLSVLNFECQKLTELSEKCFCETAIKKVVIPDCVTSMEDAFNDTYTIEYAYIPASVVEIDATFSGCPNVVVHGKAGSEAEKYAIRRHYKFVAE